MTLRSKASAPGKLVLLGEYAVLEGGTALVAAINRRAHGELVERAEAPSPVVQAVLDEVKRRGKTPRESIAIDTASFSDASGKKLGLGSSGAAAVVASALACERGDEAAYEIALDAHRIAAGGEGSGIDVAASFYGGVIAARRQPGEVRPLASHLGKLAIGVLFTNRSASTKELVASVRRSENWGRWSKILTALADEGVRAWETQNAAAFLSVVARFGRAMKGLGQDAGVEIVTEEIDAIQRIADELRAAAKPSGAGGGDVAIVFSFDPDDARRIAERTNAQLVELEIDRHGLSLR